MPPVGREGVQGGGGRGFREGGGSGAGRKKGGENIDTWIRKVEDSQRRWRECGMGRGGHLLQEKVGDKGLWGIGSKFLQVGVVLIAGSLFRSEAFV